MSDDTEHLNSGPPTEVDEALAISESELAKFYAGQNVLLTGASDLLGKCLLEKLLRGCPELKRVYLIVRAEHDLEAKCNELYQDHVFDVLRRREPNFTNRITPVRGDLRAEKLGLSESDYRLLTESANIIVHNGAARSPEGPVRAALETNVLGTKRMLELASACRRLKAFVLVSTAYSHAKTPPCCGGCSFTSSSSGKSTESASGPVATAGVSGARLLDETFHDAPVGIQAVEDMLEADAAPSGLTKDALRMLLGDWPNIYGFSMAVAEELVRKHAARAGYACCVFRPSVVISTYKEPMPGYCDKKNKAASIFALIAKGAIHVMRKYDYPCDLVPADMAVNALLTCVWDAVDRWQVEPEPAIYNYGTSQDHSINMVQIKEKVMDDPDAFMVSSRWRKPYVLFVTNMMCYLSLRVILDYIPALIVDTLLVAHGYPPEAWSLLRKSMSVQCGTQRLLRGNWRVQSAESSKARQRLNQRDRKLFFSDQAELDWSEYFLTYWRGLRIYHLNDDVTDSMCDLQSQSKCPFVRCCPCAKCPCKCKCACLCILVALAAAAYYTFGWFFGF
ncbi:hypothetical protein QAD02_004178 [Eretmocerus hayati]|uniref:Uncharacterized protein n=1 Tax=Eretmocerus hayati TaxID=131215 RepID=A0ACC2NP81_9HYME|nr:hypothetical protein QAD02_004178 [Eretmocerus hayati]